MRPNPNLTCHEYWTASSHRAWLEIRTIAASTPPTCAASWSGAARTRARAPSVVTPASRKWGVHASWVATLLAAVTATWYASPADPGKLMPPNPVPVIVLMDSPLPGRVYDPRTASEGGTNADDVTDALRELPVAIRKENTSAAWHREEQVVGENPDLIISHLSCLLDARVAGGQPAVAEHLFDLAENRLVVFFAYVAARNPRTRFIVYSRSEFQKRGGELQWVATQEARLPVLRNRLQALIVPGLDAASFRQPATAQLLRGRVSRVLGLRGGP